MEPSCTDLEFFDLTNASDEDVKEIRAILNESGSNGCVELPWELPLNVHGNSPEKCSTPCPSEELCETSISSSNSSEAVLGQTLIYAPLHISPPLSAPAPQLPLQSSDVVPQVESFIPTIPPMSAASAIGPHYAPPYFVPRTLPYLRAYTHVGLPLLTCALPSASGELTHVPSPYAPFLPMATHAATLPHQPRLEKAVDNKEDSEIRQKVRGPSDRQYNRRSRKKAMSSSSYYSGSDYGHTAESYQESAEEQTLIPPPSVSDRLSAVPSSLPVVPVHMSPSTFPVTSGALPMHSYPPGLHPLYSQISGPQPPTTPLYYVPVFNHPSYSGYISSASASMMMPLGNMGVPSSIHPTSESECSVTNEGAEDDTKSSESLAASSSESAEKTSVSSINVESDCESCSLKKLSNKDDTPMKTANEPSNRMVNVPRKIDATDSCSPESSDTLVEMNVQAKPVVCSEDVEKNVSHNAYHDNSRCWADLFKKQCSEINGLDRRPMNDTERSNMKEPKLEKDINGKLYNVPNSDNEL